MPIKEFPVGVQQKLYRQVKDLNIQEDIEKLLSKHDLALLPDQCLIAGGSVANLIIGKIWGIETPVRDLDVFYMKPKPPTPEGTFEPTEDFYQEAIVSIVDKNELSLIEVKHTNWDMIVHRFDLNCVKVGLIREKTATGIKWGLHISDDFLHFLESRLVQLTHFHSPIRSSGRLWDKIRSMGLDKTKEQKINNVIETKLLAYMIAHKLIKRHQGLKQMDGICSRPMREKPRQKIQQNRDVLDNHFVFWDGRKGELKAKPIPPKELDLKAVEAEDKILSKEARTTLRILHQPLTPKELADQPLTTELLRTPPEVYRMLTPTALVKHLKEIGHANPYAVTTLLQNGRTITEELLTLIEESGYTKLQIIDAALRVKGGLAKLPTQYLKAIDCDAALPPNLEEKPCVPSCPQKPMTGQHKNDEWTLLHTAAYYGHLEDIFPYIPNLSLLKNKKLINSRRSKGPTSSPISVLCYCGKTPPRDTLANKDIFGPEEIMEYISIKPEDRILKLPLHQITEELMRQPYNNSNKKNVLFVLLPILSDKFSPDHFGAMPGFLPLCHSVIDAYTKEIERMGPKKQEGAYAKVKKIENWLKTVAVARVNCVRQQVAKNTRHHPPRN